MRSGVDEMTIDAWAERLAIVSDEAAPSFAEAVAISMPLGIRAYEVRNLYGERVPYVSEEAVAEVLSQVEQHGLVLIGISPGFCKRLLEDPATETELETGLPSAFRLMDRLGVRTMTLFSYRRTARETPVPPRVVALLQRAAEACYREGVQLLLENSPGCWGDTGAHLAQIAAAIGVDVTWDPANAAASGELAYPDGYQLVKDRVSHVHLKNWHPEAGHVYLHQGVVDLVGQLEALEADGYAGYYCIESHRWDDALATQVNTQQLLAWLRPMCREEA
jgi:L-ribulose-5-phosphate 3-epimerase